VPMQVISVKSAVAEETMPVQLSLGR
jgi:hypothetical protein